MSLEKCSQKELMIRHDLRTRIKPVREHRLPLKNLDELEEKNRHLEKEIQSICKQVIGSQFTEMSISVFDIFRSDRSNKNRKLIGNQIQKRTSSNNIPPKRC